MVELLNAEVSVFGIVVAAAFSIPFAMLWFNPKIFGNMWLKEIGKKQKDLKMKNTDPVIAFLAALVMAFVLSLFISYLNTTSDTLGVLKADTFLFGQWRGWLIGLMAGFMAGIGFFAAVLLDEVVWEQRSFKLYMINAGHRVVSLTLMGLILALFMDL